MGLMCPVIRATFALLLGAAAELAAGAPIRTTLCDIVKNPAAFNGKTVAIRAVYVADTGLIDESCSAKVRVNAYHVLDGLTPKDGEYAFTRLGHAAGNPDDLQWKPIEAPRAVHTKATDEAFRALLKLPSGSPVSVVGRFDYFDTQAIAVRTGPGAKSSTRATGDANSPLLRLVVQWVATPADTKAAAATPTPAPAPAAPAPAAPAKPPAAAPAAVVEANKPPAKDVSEDDARKLVMLFAASRGLTKLNGFMLDAYTLPVLPDYYLFDALWNNPRPGGVVAARFAVDRLTGDLWNANQCEGLSSPAIRGVQQQIRGRLGLSWAAYQRARRPGPLCHDGVPKDGKLQAH